MLQAMLIYCESQYIASWNHERCHYNYGGLKRDFLVMSINEGSVTLIRNII